MLCALTAAADAATELRLQLQTPDGAAAKADDAELLLFSWGNVQRLPLEITPDAGGTVHVPLDAEWLRSKWEHADDLVSAFIFVKGRGFVPLRSDPFTWLGSDDLNGSPSTATTIAFGQGQTVTVNAGQTQTLVLNVRKDAQVRRLKFLDDEDRPVTDITVSAFMPWSSADQCGVLAGKDPLAADLHPDADGVVTLPDGDFPYALDVTTGRYVEVRDSESEPNGVVITRLAEGDRLIRIHRYRKQPLSLRVVVGRRPPLEPPPFVATVLVPKECGMALRPLDAVMPGGKYAADGTYTIDEFYPEAIEAICLADNEGLIVWSLTEFRQQFRGRPLLVRLPGGTELSLADSCGSQ